VSSLADLIAEAKAKDPFFKRSIEYRINGRKSPKPPDLDWLMPQLERILGKSYVKKAANDYVEKLMKEVDANKVDEPAGAEAPPEEPKSA
jgi:hypothetical protein